MVKGHKGLLKALLVFTRYHDFVTYEKIDNISLYIFKKCFIVIYNSLDNQIYVSSMNCTQKLNKALSSSEPFSKSIKKDGKTHQIFQEDQQCDKWNQSVKAVMQTHDCEEVFDISYVPLGE